MTRINPDDPPQRLAEINHQQFYNLVDADIRRKIDPKVSAKLRDPAVAMRWHLVLTQMRRTTEGAIASRTSEYRMARAEILGEIEALEGEITDLSLSNGHASGDVDEKRRKIDDLRADLRQLLLDFEDWRVKSLRFKSGVEEKMTEAQWARHLAERSVLDAAALQERTLLHLELGAVRSELETLRTAITKHRAERRNPSADDRALWAILDAAAGPATGALSSTGAEVRRLLGG